MLTYRAWAICRRDLAAAEITMDESKAAVWKRGGHAVIELIGTRDVPNHDQGELKYPTEEAGKASMEANRHLPDD